MMLTKPHSSKNFQQTLNSVENAAHKLILHNV